MTNPFYRRNARAVADDDFGLGDGFEHDEGMDGHDDEAALIQARPLLNIFKDALLAADEKSGRYRPPGWLRKWTARQQSSTCAYCGVALDVGAQVAPDAHKAIADLLVPVNAGGTAHLDNVVLCCVSCKHNKGALDWIGFGRAADEPALRAQRIKALMRSNNHVLPLTVKRQDVAKEALGARWAHPRFRVFAGVFLAGGFFAWDKESLPPRRNGELALTLRLGFGATDKSDGRWALFQVTKKRFHEAAWDLLDHNALLERVDMDGVEALTYPAYAPELEHEHWERWFVTMTGTQWLRETRRVAKWSTQAKPVRHAVVAQQVAAAKRAPLLNALRLIDEAFANATTEVSA